MSHASLTLEGPRVVLRPMTMEDAPALVRAASDGELWRSDVSVIPNEHTVEKYIRTALDGAASGHTVPFVTTLRDTGEVIGSTRFWKIDRTHRKLEIGHTWLAQRWQRSFANTEAKWLMLTHAFEQWACVRVQFSTDELNTRSREAIARLGAVQEGILRNERIMPSGRIRNTVRFSILDTEWPQVRAGLQTRVFQP